MNGYTNGAHSNGADGGDSRGRGSYPPIAEIVGSATETVEALRNHTASRQYAGHGSC
jgi:ubiquitin carboxyl-terminal hydrolase 8